jgi:hypothetical protein
MTIVVFVIAFVISAVVLIQDQRERIRMNKEAALRRVRGEDTRPLQYLPAPTLPWKQASWSGLNGVESAGDGLQRSTRRGLERSGPSRSLQG